MNKQIDINREPILIQNLKIKYKGTEVVKGMNAEISSGSLVALVGASGQGKTSIIHAMMELIPFEGAIQGLENKKIAAVFQEDRLIESMSVFSNIAMTTKANRQTIEGHLEELSLKQDQSKAAKELSGGMKRRVAIIRAMLAESDVIILDEPFKGLDDKIKKETMDYVKKHGAGKTLILVTHDGREIDYMGCDKIIDLSKEAAL